MEHSVFPSPLISSGQAGHSLKIALVQSPEKGTLCRLTEESCPQKLVSNHQNGLVLCIINPIPDELFSQLIPEGK